MRQRWKRFWGPKSGHGVFSNHFSWATFERFVLLADMLFFPEILTALNRLVKWNTRRLSAREIALAQSIFEETIDYQKVRMDERSHIGCRQGHFAYVSFELINSWGALSDQHFIHEMTHVWQYQQGGSRYIPRALWAQRTPVGYNYGGIAPIQAAAEAGRGVEQFNYEQQGDIVADYFCLKNGFAPRWCEPNPAYLPYFEQVVKKSLFG